MERKPQQQTLSIRISDTLRDFLEESRGLMADTRNESVSVSWRPLAATDSAKNPHLTYGELYPPNSFPENPRDASPASR